MKYDPLNDGISLVEYIDHMGSDESICRSARVSYSNENDILDPDRDIKLINYLAKNNHSSPFQHCMVTFHVVCPLIVYSQWRRHRTFNYTQINEVSRRYTSDDIDFFFPEKWRGQAHLNKQGSEGSVEDQFQITTKFISTVSECVEVYDWMLDMGVAREQARMILPQNLYTRFYATVDLWNLKHFYDLRVDPHAQEEIQVYGIAIGKILEELFPIGWKALSNG